MAYLAQAEGFLPLLCQGCSRTPKGSHGVVSLQGQVPGLALVEEQNAACMDAIQAYLGIWSASLPFWKLHQKLHPRQKNQA